MIDNIEKAMELLEKMKTQLPIPVVTTKELLNILRQNSIEFPKDHSFQIENVLYMGDGGGICCGISLPDDAKKAVVTSLTHLRIPPGHSLAREIKSYQKKRVKKLAKQRW